MEGLLAKVQSMLDTPHRLNRRSLVVVEFTEHEGFYFDTYVRTHGGLTDWFLILRTGDNYTTAILVDPTLIRHAVTNSLGDCTNDSFFKKRGWKKGLKIADFLPPEAETMFNKLVHHATEPIPQPMNAMTELEALQSQITKLQQESAEKIALLQKELADKKALQSKLDATRGKLDEVAKSEGWESLEACLEGLGYGKLSAKPRAARKSTKSGSEGKRKRTTVTPELREKVIAQLKAGTKTQQEIADENGIVVGTVQNIKKSAGIKKK